MKIEIEVMTYMRTHGGFMKPIQMFIDQRTDDALKGKLDMEDGRTTRGRNYWRAINALEEVIDDQVRKQTGRPAFKNRSEKSVITMSRGDDGIISVKYPKK